ncbi:unnamed protein product [Protopolystoma xenopodis]|uniref:Uncharacterized protein n=1 Tax=Protopolystoma xenopodis TaxID=117903 RepID=A0A3S5CQC0_9PLAT|nr:unnamed protein product [Protopolystoma xenopodis]
MHNRGKGKITDNGKLEVKMKRSDVRVIRKSCGPKGGLVESEDVAIGRSSGGACSMGPVSSALCTSQPQTADSFWPGLMWTRANVQVPLWMDPGRPSL